MEDVNEKKREIVNEINNQLDAYSEEELSAKLKAVEERLFEFANFLDSTILMM